MTDPFAHWPDRTPLVGDDGRTLLVYSLSGDPQDGRPWADGVWRPDDIPVADAVAEALRRLPGHAVSTSDRELVAAFGDAGAETLRHAHVMSHDLAGLDDLRRTPTPDHVRTHRLTAQQLLRQAQRIGPLLMTAYPPGHPDHRYASVEHAIRGLHLVAQDDVLGPFLDVSQVAILDHAVIGAALIVERPGVAPDGGPWLLDLFRDPASPVKGVGRALLVASLTAAERAGLASMTLVVSHSNTTARALYESLGFADHGQSWTLALPS